MTDRKTYDHALIDFHIRSVKDELLKALAKHGPMHSAHEAYGVIAEEWHEFMLAMHANDKYECRKEARQIAAMCLRYLLDT